MSKLFNIGIIFDRGQVKVLYQYIKIIFFKLEFFSVD